MDQITKAYKQKSLHHFDKIAADYNQSWAGKWSALMYEDVMAKINQQPFVSLLDVGCGTGNILTKVLEQHQDVQACGLDFSPRMVAKATESLAEKAQIVLGDADHLPWLENSFDVLICNSSFHHYPEPLNVLTEMKRVLKPEGRLIIAEPLWSSLTRFFINIYLKTPFNQEGDVRVYSRKELVNMLSKCDFRNIVWERPNQKYCIACAMVNK